MVKKKLTVNIGNHGNIAIIVAISLTILIGMLAIVIDGGYLYASKNKWQNGVEAAAMAGVSRLCDGDVEATARQIAQENGLASGPESLTVLTGFYDENDEYNDFTTYRDFAADGAGDYPDDEYNNAVMVSLNADVSTFLAGIFNRDQVRVSAEAVSYLRRLGMVSLAEDGEIRINTGSSWKNGDIYANGDIKYPEECTVDNVLFPTPEFINSDMFAAGEILECPVYDTDEIDWDNGIDSELPNAYPGSPEITEIRPIDDEYVEEFRAKADMVYDINSEPDDILYYSETYNGLTTYYFDITRDHGSSRITYFFDAGGNDNIDIHICDALPPSSSSHSPNGNSIINITFAANCRIRLHHAPYPSIPIGAEGGQQTIIISSKDIKIIKGLHYEGVVFLCGGDFVEYMPMDCVLRHFSSPDRKMRVIANESIGSAELVYWPIFGGLGFNWDFKFGPPCPGAPFPRLGKLEPGEG